MSVLDRLRSSPTRSLRSRLSWSASLVVAVWVLLLAVGGNELLSSVLAGQADDVLRARAEAVAQTVQVADDGTISVLESQDDRALDLGTWIFDETGSVVEAPPRSSPDLTAAASRLALTGGGTADLGGDGALRLLALPVVDDGAQVAAVVTSTSLSPYRQVERAALLGSVALALALIVIVHLVLRANVSRALRPVQQMSAQAGRWSADDVERRFGAEPRPAELAELAETLDQLLDRLAAVIRHEQRFSEELSHELRTPLARVQAEVDLLIAHPRTVVELADAHAAIDRSTRSMRTILDTMMSAARSSGPQAPGRARVGEALQHLADPDGARTGTAIEVVSPPSLVVGVDGDVVLRALSPVVDNAVRFARSRVLVVAAEEAGRVRITVSDDGPGMTAQVAERAFEPGYRGDPDDGHGGAGLGLALTRRLVAAAGGSVQAAPDSDGGRVEVLLPRA